MLVITNPIFICRQDLANAVRRRGYKVVAHLLGLAPGPEAAHSTSTDEAKESTAISTTRDSSVNGAAGNFSAESHQASRKGDNETGCVTVSNSEAESLSPGRSVSEGESLNEAVSLSEGTLRESLASSPTLVPEILNTETQKQESVGQTSLGVKADYIQERQLNIIKGKYIMLRVECCNTIHSYIPKPQSVSSPAHKLQICSSSLLRSDLQV